MEIITKEIVVPECLKSKLIFGDTQQIRSLKCLNEELNSEYKAYRYKHEVSFYDEGVVVASSTEEAEEISGSFDNFTSLSDVDWDVNISTCEVDETIDVQIKLVW